MSAVMPVEALRALALAGASDALLGQAVRELLAGNAPLPVQHDNARKPAASVGRLEHGTAVRGVGMAPALSPTLVSQAGPSAGQASLEPSAGAGAPAPNPAVNQPERDHDIGPDALPSTARKGSTRPSGIQAPAPSGAPLIVNFKDATGKRSSISISASRWATLKALVPEDAELLALVRKVAATAPSEGNRSTWVYETVLAKLQKPAA